jgi:anti-sigma regulatory factor (Ser/Thr protein kinase)
MNQPVVHGSAAVPISDPSQVGEARRLATTLASRLAFNEVQTGRVGIIVTEAATNILKHARHGELLLTPVQDGSIGGLEITAVDRGPGMANLSRCFSDGFSTSGTSGTGLGAIARQASSFDAHSTPGAGAAVLARIWAGAEPARAVKKEFTAGAVSLPLAGEEVCGDAWAMDEQPGRCLVAVVDGLGHGWQAAEASQEALRIFRKNAHQRPAAILEAAHLALRSTRGAAMAIVEINRDQGEVRYAGVGNISGSLTTPAGRSNMVSHNGIVGHQARRFQEFMYRWAPDALLVMHSDGLGTQWRVEDYPGLTQRDPSLIAAVLYRDFARGRDDVTVVALRESVGAGAD